MNLEKLSQWDVRTTETLTTRANMKINKQMPKVETAEAAFEIAICKACEEVKYPSYTASGTIKPSSAAAETYPIKVPQEAVAPRDIFSMTHLNISTRTDYKNAVEKRVDTYMNQNPETKRVINHYWNTLLKKTEQTGEKPVPSADSFAKYIEERPKIAQIAKEHNRFFNFLFKHVEAGHIGLPLTEQFKLSK